MVEQPSAAMSVRPILITARFCVHVVWLDLSTRFSSVRSVQVSISLGQLDLDFTLNLFNSAVSFEIHNNNLR